MTVSKSILASSPCGSAILIREQTLKCTRWIIFFIVLLEKHSLRTIKQIRTISINPLFHKGENERDENELGSVAHDEIYDEVTPKHTWWILIWCFKTNERKTDGLSSGGLGNPSCEQALSSNSVQKNPPEGSSRETSTNPRVILNGFSMSNRSVQIRSRRRSRGLCVSRQVIARLEEMSSPEGGGKKTRRKSAIFKQSA